MGGYAVIKGSAYTLAAAPDMVIHNGTTQTTERVVNPESEYLKKLPEHLRSFEDVVNYIPHQVYIGNLTPETLKETPFPWYDKKAEGASPMGKFGEIIAQDEFLGLIRICDVFDLVILEKNFAEGVKAKLAANELVGALKASVLDKNTDDIEAIKKLVEEEHAECLYHNN